MPSRLPSGMRPPRGGYLPVFGRSSTGKHQNSGDGNRSTPDQSIGATIAPTCSRRTLILPLSPCVLRHGRHGGRRYRPNGWPGAILVFERSGSDHVGFYTGEDAAAYRVLRGDQGDTFTTASPGSSLRILLGRSLRRLRQHHGDLYGPTDDRLVYLNVGHELLARRLHCQGQATITLPSSTMPPPGICVFNRGRPASIRRPVSALPWACLF